MMSFAPMLPVEFNTLPREATYYSLLNDKIGVLFDEAIYPIAHFGVMKKDVNSWLQTDTGNFCSKNHIFAKPIFFFYICLTVFI